MLKGSYIPEPLTMAGILDRTLWLIRHRFYQFMLINITTFAAPFLCAVLLYNLDFIDFGLDPDYQVMEDFFFLFLFVGFPTVLSDMASQHYISAIVRDQEIKWYQAVRRSFNLSLIRYFFIKSAVWAIVILVSGIGLVVAMVPFVGSILYYVILIGIYVLLGGVMAPILVEEKNPIFKPYARNVSLVGTQFFGSIFSGVLSGMISWCLMFCLWIFVAGIGSLIMYLLFGSTEQLATQDDTWRFVWNLVKIVGPILFILFYMPVKCAYSGVLYYNLRARKEGFHLENKLDIHARKEKAVAQEAEISATA